MIETLTCDVCGEVFAPYIVQPQFACPECGHQHDLPEEHVQYLAQQMYPHHAPSTALANYKAGREIWDTNGDAW